MNKSRQHKGVHVRSATHERLYTTVIYVLMYYMFTNCTCYERELKHSLQHSPAIESFHFAMHILHILV